MTYQMFKLRKCIILRNKYVDFKFHGINTSQKEFGQGNVYHCVSSPLLFIKVCKCLGTEETSCSSLGIGMLSHSCLIQAFSCSILPLYNATKKIWTDYSHVVKCKVFPERDDVWMGTYVVLELGYTFQHWWSLSRCVSCPCHTHSCNPIPSEMQASELSADNNLGCPCPL